jgi:Hypoxia induced protein conserved region
MTNLVTPLSYIAVLLVLGVLFAGLLNMLRTDGANMSQRLMRWRVGLQFVAICVLMIAMYWKRS